MAEFTIHYESGATEVIEAETPEAAQGNATYPNVVKRITLDGPIDADHPDGFNENGGV